MKQLLLILAFLLPLCAYPQLKEPFNGLEITSDNPWTGDLDCFVIETGWLVSRADPTRKSVSIETPLVYSATMEWEFEIRMDFKPSDQNHIRLHVYLDDQRMLGLKSDYYVQIGSNKKTITFRKHTATEKNPKILIEKALDVLLGAVDLKVKLTLENHKIWNLYVLEKGRFVLIGSCESEVSSSCKGGQLRFECRYSKTRVNDFACNYIIISDNISIEPEKPDTPEEPNEPDEPLVLPRLLAIQPITESVFQLQYNLPVDIREAIFSISGIGNASHMTYADDMRIHVNISLSQRPSSKKVRALRPAMAQFSTDTFFELNISAITLPHPHIPSLSSSLFFTVLSPIVNTTGHPSFRLEPVIVSCSTGFK